MCEILISIISKVVLDGSVVNMQLVLYTVLLVAVVFAQEECFTPTRSEGICIPIIECDYLKPQKALTPEERENLKQWHCGFKGEVPKVCCPSESITIRPVEKVKPTTLAPKPASQKNCVTGSGTYGYCVKLAIFTRKEHCKETDEPPSVASKCCGLDLADDNRSTSGNAAINQFPWLALIEQLSKKGRITCTGVLISSRYVLTAAQCLYHAPKNVRLGEFNKTNSGPDCLVVDGKNICNEGAITIPIEHVISHPEFDKRNYHGHDIAVIKLAQQVPYNEFIRPICLPETDITASAPSNLRFINAGWGRKPASDQEEDVVKHYVELPYVPFKKCKEIYSSRNFRRYAPVSEDHICAGGEKGLDCCTGGGPLMSEKDGRYTLDGIVSFGAVPCGTEGIPSVYTKVYSFLPWIRKVTSV